MALSTSDVAFEGFRIARERPLAVAAWTLLQLISSVASTAVLVSMAGPVMSLYMPGAAPPTDPQVALSMMGRLFSAYGVMLVVGLVFFALVNAGVCRVVLQPQKGGAFGLGLGADELRQAGVAALLFAVLFGIYIGCVLVIALVGGIFAAVGGQEGTYVGISVGVTATLCLFAWLTVKLSLASALSFDTGKVDVFGSWALTRGRFWPLFGAYALAWVMAAVVAALIAVIFLAVASVTGSGLTGVYALMTKPDYSSLQAFFSPMRLLYIVFAGLISGLSTAIISGACAKAYTQLKTTESSVF